MKSCDSFLSTVSNKTVGSVFSSIVASEDFNIFISQTGQFHNLIATMFFNRTDTFHEFRENFTLRLDKVGSCVSREIVSEGEQISASAYDSTCIRPHTSLCTNPYGLVTLRWLCFRKGFLCILLHSLSAHFAHNLHW